MYRYCDEFKATNFVGNDEVNRRKQIAIVEWNEMRENSEQVNRIGK